MGLLLVFIVSLVAGQAIAISLGLLVERHYSSYAGLVTFIALLFHDVLVGMEVCGSDHRTRHTAGRLDGQ